MRIILFIAIVLILAAGTAGMGVYDISARDPHWGITREVIEFVRDRSIVARSSLVKIPPIDVAALAGKGAGIYRELCSDCHGAPGAKPEAFAQGLYPYPANLLAGSPQKEWKDHQLYWIIDNGLKMTGMPSFDAATEQDERLAVVAFLRRLPGMTPQEYRSMAGAAGSE